MELLVVSAADVLHLYLHFSKAATQLGCCHLDAHGGTVLRLPPHQRDSGVSAAFYSFLFFFFKSVHKK